MSEGIVVLDYGSQYSQLIARRIREKGFYSELFPWNSSEKSVMEKAPRGFVLSGGPRSVYAPGAPTLPDYLLESRLPILGICYGMQLLAHSLDGKVAPASESEYGQARIELIDEQNLLLPVSALEPEFDVWMSHGDRIEQVPAGFNVLARTRNSPVAAIGDTSRNLYGLQFHPEVTHTEHGADILAAFAGAICRCQRDWTPAKMIDEAVEAIRKQVGPNRLVLGLSGGVDSSVVAVLAHKAIGDRLTSIFVDTGMLRLGEAEQVKQTFEQTVGLNLISIDAADEFLDMLGGVVDPEQKRKLIGERFVRIFEREAKSLLDEGDLYLAQGTIYPDVIESAAIDRPDAMRIKTHHNVGGLPVDMEFAGVVEPLRYLFKDEVRRVGTELGLPDEIVWRQPFPGPGLAIRIAGNVTKQGLDKLRQADAILRQELAARGWLRDQTAQAFAVLLPIKSVGVMGDGRTYEQPIVIRAVQTDDFMTASWARLDYDVLAYISQRIVNEVDGINRVLYDVTSKPPATIEWE
ncbi:MAG: glutamine-hydrolyzing GMP synthase [Chloroflexota bacterium]